MAFIPLSLEQMKHIAKTGLAEYESKRIDFTSLTLSRRFGVNRLSKPNIVLGSKIASLTVLTVCVKAVNGKIMYVSIDAGGKDMNHLTAVREIIKMKLTT